MKGFNLSLISTYRGALMGVSTLGIIMCHTHGYVSNIPGSISQVLSLGQIGVLLFFMLSGVGLFYSLQNFEYSADSLYRWYKKRFARILIPYLLIYAPVLSLTEINGGGGSIFV